MRSRRPKCSLVPRGSGAAVIDSRSALALDNTVRSATLESVEEINTTPTSFSPFGPAWTGLGTSTALATIGGVYDGSNGAGTLRFEVRRAGVHGQDRLRIRIRDPNESVIGNVTIQPNDPLGEQYGIGNGLFFTLGAGSLVRNDDLVVNLSDTVGSAVTPSNPFDGIRNANPNLDPGQSVTGGSLVINGVSIGVGASDSIDTMLSAINQSAAGVTATFDTARERVVLTRNTPGSVPTVRIDSDDSGFAAATKLAGALATPGRDADIDSPLANVNQFQSVQSGNITVNGTSVAIDVQTDSLRTILDRINAAQQTATASYSEPPQRVTFIANTQGQAIGLDEGSTGFLAALNIPAGTYRPGRTNGLSAARAAAVADGVERIAARLNGYLSTAAASETLRGLGNGLAQTLADFVRSERDPANGTFGIRIDSAAQAARLDVAELGRDLRRDASTTLRFLVGNGSSLGFLDSLASGIDQALAQIGNRLGTRGSVINRFA